MVLTKGDIIQYDVEKAFRISKTDLKIRPIYHRLENRIKAHILVSFVSYAVYKEIAHNLGIKEYKVCSCPNFSDTFIQTIIALI